MAKGGNKRKCDEDDSSKTPVKSSRYNFTSTGGGSPLQSSSDTKSYRFILLENGLRCLLISDSGENRNPVWAQHSYNDGVMRLKKDGCCTSFSCEKLPDIFCNTELPQEFNMASTVKAEDRAAFCMIVQAGGADDPEEVQGMAHFTEHMLHYGSKKYPGEGKYWNFIQNFGNDVNAYTQPHTTTYQCSIHPNFLSTAVDIFANIVTYPSFDADCAAREVSAIDSEFYLRKNNLVIQIIDIVRLNLPDNHPLKFFTCGNSTTLNEKGKTLKGHLQEFHRKNYVAKKMVFAIQSPDSLDHLQKLVEKCMNNIPSGDAVDDSKNGPNKSYVNDNAFHKLYTLKGEPRLCLIWQLPADVWKNFKGKPLEVFDTVMNDGRVGGLRHYLFQQGWITDFLSGSIKVEAFQNKYSTLYIFMVSLTLEGEENISQVVQSVFEYTYIISKTSPEDIKKIWDDLQEAADQKFEYSGDGTPLNNTHYAARTLINSPTVEEIFTSQLLFEEFNHNDFVELFKNIQPKNTLFIRYNPKWNGASAKELPHTKIQYKVNSVPTEWGKKSKKGGLQFPEPNPFITKRFHIEKGTESSMATKPKMVLQHKVIPGLTIPKAILQISFLSTEGCKSPHERYMLSMLTNYVFMAMDAEQYCARKAGLYSAVQFRTINTDMSVIDLQVSGFPEFIPEMVKAFLKGFSGPNTTEMPERIFNQLKFAQMSEYKEQFSSSEYLSMLLYQRMMIGDFPSEIDTRFTPDDITKLQFEKFISRFRSSMIITALMEGNLSKKVVDNLSGTLENFEYEGPKDIPTHIPAIPSLANGERAIRIRLRTPDAFGDENNTVLNLYEVESSGSQAYEIAKIVANLMTGRVFQVLRTEEQLGYYLLARGPRNEGLPITFHFMILTPAHKKTPCEVSGRMDNFLRVFYERFLSQMTEKEYVDALLKVDLSNYISLMEVKSWYQDNITNRLPNPANGNRFVGLKKLSLQVVAPARPRYSAKCKKDCIVCENMDWVVGENPNLEFARIKSSGSAKGKPSPDYFISSISQFHNENFR